MKPRGRQTGGTTGAGGCPGAGWLPDSWVLDLGVQRALRLAARDDPALAAPASEDHSDVRRALLALPRDYREPLMLQVLMGYSTEEIASQLGITQANVLTRLYRAEFGMTYPQWRTNVRVFHAMIELAVSAGIMLA